MIDMPTRVGAWMLVLSLGSSLGAPALAQDDSGQARVGLLLADPPSAPTAEETRLGEATSQAAELTRHPEASGAQAALLRAHSALREARGELQAGRRAPFQRSIEMAETALALASRQIAARAAERVRARATQRAAMAEADLERARVALAALQARSAAELAAHDRAD